VAYLFYAFRSTVVFNTHHQNIDKTQTTAHNIVSKPKTGKEKKMYVILGIACGVMIGALVTLSRHLGKKPRCQYGWLKCPATYFSMTVCGIFGLAIGIMVIVMR
jgi:hypothetical protein